MGDKSTRGVRINWLIDPSGYVYDAATNERLPGVKATCYWIPFQEKNAEEYWKATPSRTEFGEEWNADGNGEIESSDARLILRASVKLEDTARWGR